MTGKVGKFKSALAALKKTERKVSIYLPLVMGALWLVPWWRGFVGDYFPAIALIGITIVISAVFRLAESTSEMEDSITKANAAKSLIIKHGVIEIYEDLRRELKSAPRHQRSLKVLGLTLFSARNHVIGFALEKDTQGFDIELLCLSPDYLSSGIKGIPADWTGQATQSISDINDFTDRKREHLATNSIHLQLSCYRAFPAVHGFLVGNGTLFIAFTLWEEGDDELRLPFANSPYERVDARDHSERAEVYRALFSNWFEHAKLTSKQCGSGTSVIAQHGSGVAGVDGEPP